MENDSSSSSEEDLVLFSSRNVLRKEQSMPQSIQEVIGHVGKGVAGLTLLATLVIIGTIPHAKALTNHPFRTTTMHPSFVAFSTVRNVPTMWHQHRAGTILAAFRSPGYAQTVSGGKPSAGEEMTNQNSKEESEHNTIEFHGRITSRVGADNMLHFTVGSIPWSIPLAANTDLHEVGGSPQAIQPNQKIEVEVQVTGTNMVVTKVEPGD
jgi:hypothetical protein